MLGKANECRLTIYFENNSFRPELTLRNQYPLSQHKPKFIVQIKLQDAKDSKLDLKLQEMRNFIKFEGRREGLLVYERRR